MNAFNFQQAQPKKRQTTYTNDSIIESLRSLGGGVGKAVTRDVVGKVGSGALASLFGNPPKRGEMRANESIDFPQYTRETLRPRPIRPEFDRTQLVRLDETHVREQLEAVRAELKVLAVSVKNFNQDVQKAINEVSVHPGIYHLNFMERLRSILKILREQIEDSRSWLALSTNRKKKRQYWGMYKKHGTQFGLSSERTLATQAG